MNEQPDLSECDGWECPFCERCIVNASAWSDGQCPHCSRYYTWEDQVQIVDDSSKNTVTIDRDEYERLKAANPTAANA